MFVDTAEKGHSKDDSEFSPMVVGTIYFQMLLVYLSIIREIEVND